MQSLRDSASAPTTCPDTSMASLILGCRRRHELQPQFPHSGMGMLQNGNYLPQKALCSTHPGGRKRCEVSDKSFENSPAREDERFDPWRQARRALLTPQL